MDRAIREQYNNVRDYSMRDVRVKDIVFLLIADVATNTRGEEAKSIADSIVCIDGPGRFATKRGTAKVEVGWALEGGLGTEGTGVRGLKGRDGRKGRKTKAVKERKLKTVGIRGRAAGRGEKPITGMWSSTTQKASTGAGGNDYVIKGGAAALEGRGGRRGAGTCGRGIFDANELFEKSIV